MIKYDQVHAPAPVYEKLCNDESFKYAAYEGALSLCGLTWEYFRKINDEGILSECVNLDLPDDPATIVTCDTCIFFQLKELDD